MSKFSSVHVENALFVSITLSYPTLLTFSVTQCDFMVNDDDDVLYLTLREPGVKRRWEGHGKGGQLCDW